jgi:predicted Fe-Mo cluster-binding NifX family protein
MKTKAAFAFWEGRISPVFDVARQVHVVEAGSGRIIRETRESLPDGMAVNRALRLAELGVGTLVCGAISRPTQVMIAAQGIRVIPFVAGDLRAVVRAWLSGVLAEKHFFMPGCYRKKKRQRPKGVHSTGKEDQAMNGRNRGGGGRCSGQGGGGKGRGRVGGPSGAGQGGFCVCPQCGRREPHERGVPCMDKTCPACGVAMEREQATKEKGRG